MIKSMTGFGRCEVSEESRKVTVEMKSVNHRYLDMNVRLPKSIVFFETTIRNELKKHIQRGKIDIFISYEDTSENSKVLAYNEDLAGEYLTYLTGMGKKFGIENDIKVSHLSRFPEIFSMEEMKTDEEALWKFLKGGILKAVSGFVQTREQEGGNLKKDILAKLEGMQQLIGQIEVRSPEVLKEYRARLEEKVHDLLSDSTMDENRVLSEVVLYADKICTDEEIVRLKSHISHMNTTFEQGDSIGRKLDFIAQEMNREANTILSKANDLEVSNYAIDLKTEIEKIREQIQNIE